MLVYPMSPSEISIASAVIFYRPTTEVIKNIESYISVVEKLFVIDNSEQPDELLYKSMKCRFSKKLSLIINGENKGIAVALNQAATKAIEDGYLWLLTMDQDSCFYPGAVEKLVMHINDNIYPQPIGILAANLKINQAKEEEGTRGIIPLPTALTSGSLLNLEAYKKTGPFMDKFFIDFVDHEYSLRLRKNNYDVLECSDAILNHHLGETDTHKLFGKILNVTNHNYIRRYYLTRNRFAVCKKYFKIFPSYSFLLLWFSFTDLFLILFFEKDKWRKLKSVFLGTKDFVIGRYGKYPYSLFDAKRVI